MPRNPIPPVPPTVPSIAHPAFLLKSAATDGYPHPSVQRCHLQSPLPPCTPPTFRRRTPLTKNKSRIIPESRREQTMKNNPALHAFLPRKSGNKANTSATFPASSSAVQSTKHEAQRHKNHTSTKAQIHKNHEMHESKHEHEERRVCTTKSTWHALHGLHALYVGNALYARNTTQDRQVCR